LLNHVTLCSPRFRTPREFAMSHLLALGSSVALFCFVRFDRLLRRWSDPVPTSIWSGALQDLTPSKSQLMLENALLRHQLVILQRQSKLPHFTSADRFWFLVLASRLKDWNDALVLLQPETLLRWHRAGFYLFWKHKSNTKTTQPKIAAETIALIQQMAQYHPLWSTWAAWDKRGNRYIWPRGLLAAHEQLKLKARHFASPRFLTA